MPIVPYGHYSLAMGWFAEVIVYIAAAQAPNL